MVKTITITGKKNDLVALRESLGALYEPGSVKPFSISSIHFGGARPQFFTVIIKADRADMAHAVALFNSALDERFLVLDDCDLIPAPAG